MKIFQPPYCCQGEVNFFAVAEIPENVPNAPKHTDGRSIVGHSETGAVHVIEGNAIRVYEQDDYVSFVDVPEQADVIHLRGFDTHETIRLPAGKYRITRQREHTPEGYRRAAD